jgi:hypothetical protein
MGGYGSGRWGGRATIEGTQALVLDVNWLVRHRLLVKGQHRSGTISNERMSLRVFADCDPSRAMFLDLDGEAETFEHGRFALRQRIGLEWAPTNFRGHRWLFICPLRGNPAQKLYLPNGAQRFGGRLAFRLKYVSQRLGRADRLARKARKLHRRLGGDGQALGAIPPDRPKGMRQVTYERLLARWDAADAMADAAWTAGAMRLLGRLR